MMIWSPPGIIGSVSGGCVEDDLIERFAAGEFHACTPCVIRYGDGSELGKQVQLPCGGIMQVLIEAVSTNDQPRWQQLLESLASREGLSRCVDLNGGQWRAQSSEPHKLEFDDSTVRVYLGPTRKLLIIGANQISYYLANFARSIDFEVSICDPREKVASEWQLPDVEFISRYPDGIIEQRFADPNSAIVAVSHDPRLDDMALMEALPSKAFYVGAMGSKRTSTARLERLRTLELPEALLQRLHAPIGLDIGSKTPAEIALSIAAHLVECYASNKTA